MENAELYIIDEVDTYFVTKTGKFEFQISNEILEKIDHEEYVYLLIKTDHYYFMKKSSVFTIKKSNKISIGIRKYYDGDDNININFIYHSFGVSASGLVTVFKREPRKEFYENNN